MKTHRKEIFQSELLAYIAAMRHHMCMGYTCIISSARSVTQRHTITEAGETGNHGPLALGNRVALRLVQYRHLDLHHDTVLQRTVCL